MKRMLLLGVCTLFGCWPLAGAQDQPSPTEQVRLARLASNKSILDRKMPEYLATITPDFVITTGNGRAYTRAEFLEIWRVNFANDNWLGCMRTTEDIEVSESVPEAAEHGHFNCVTKQRDGTEFYSGTYLAMWRNDGGVWRTSLGIIRHSQLHGQRNMRGRQAMIKPRAALPKAIR